MGISHCLAKTSHRIEAVPKARHDKSLPRAYCKQIKDDDNEPMLSANAKYKSWLEKHPPALSSFEGMMRGAKGKRIVVFLDYDGTLSPIVNDPDKAFMSDLMRSTLSEVATHFPTAIISGRSREKVYRFVKLDEVYYAGSHGMDIMGPAKQLESDDRKYQTKTLDNKGNVFTLFQPAQDFLPQIKKMLSELKEKTSDVDGVLVEDNMFCISVHHRNVLKEDHGLVKKKVEAVLSNYPKFHLTKGLEVLEIRPTIKFNKGDALLYLLETLGFANSKNVLPFYIGDDNTDEDAFKVLKSRKQGCPIIVSCVPKESLASYSLRNPSEVQSFLMLLARWGADHSSH
ncbi:PREDICTED: probable trehalose-phosphate phosphatase 2 [Ipomoea nil]|uniref:probable trehalose-phosphate phosphatase 2 n=1 Tax=Ipomoea nil TaxID=35883 RepID=UPI000901B781|nr:PREDICTED: probable trehalose-phosphate phosphatase 2 [Ipomoea nil]XP_019200455.1 PREDICTED: probable trehalose-phosphate phosphatase 2 [Ipomoea nil]